jgi:hypothetical protein
MGMAEIAAGQMCTVASICFHKVEIAHHRMM